MAPKIPSQRKKGNLEEKTEVREGEWARFQYAYRVSSEMQEIKSYLMSKYWTLAFILAAVVETQNKPLPPSFFSYPPLLIVFLCSSRTFQCVKICTILHCLFNFVYPATNSTHSVDNLRAPHCLYLLAKQRHESCASSLMWYTLKTPNESCKYK